MTGSAASGRFRLSGEPSPATALEDRWPSPNGTSKPPAHGSKGAVTHRRPPLLLDSRGRFRAFPAWPPVATTGKACEEASRLQKPVVAKSQSSPKASRRLVRRSASPPVATTGRASRQASRRKTPFAFCDAFCVAPCDAWLCQTRIYGRGEAGAHRPRDRRFLRASYHSRKLHANLSAAPEQPNPSLIVS